MEIKDIAILGAVAIGGYFLYTKIAKPIVDVVGGAENAVELITTPGADIIFGPGTADAIMKPGYQTVPPIIEDLIKKANKKIKDAGIDPRPGYQIIGDLLSPGGYVNKNTGLNTPAVVASNKAYAMIHPAPPIVTATATTSAMLTSGSNAVQSTQYMTGPKIVSGRKVM